MENNNTLISLSQAVETIKKAILQGQLEAVKNVNRVQLAVYFSIDRYLSKNSNRFDWGTGVMEKISKKLHKDLEFFLNQTCTKCVSSTRNGKC